MNRKIILDTETTGISPKQGHRVIEIACLEMVDNKLTGNNFQTYIHPQRLVDEGAFRVHGISNDFLADKPRFKDIYKQFIAFIGNSPIIAHNAQFDIGFLDHEINLAMASMAPPGFSYTLYNHRQVICTRNMAESKYGRGGNKLDNLCDRFGINREGRTLHGALIDCELLAEVYLKLIEVESDINDDVPFRGCDELPKESLCRT